MLKAVFILIFIDGSIFADSWKPASGVEQIDVWPKGANVLSLGIKELKGKKNLAQDAVTDVSTPTYTVYSSKKNYSGAAVIVFPGGGYKLLAMDFEGSEVCKWINDSGVTCILLKYRVPYSGCYWDNKTHKHITPPIPMALQDAQRTISIIRFNAKKYNLAPNKIGVLGFSAGGNLAVLSSTAFKSRSYEPIDEIDKVSSRPDFAILVYPGHMTMEHKNKTPKEIAAKELNTDILISSEIPPTLLIHAKDDRINPVYYSELYEKELRKVGVMVQLNMAHLG